MGLLSSIKNDVKKSGQTRGKFIYFREGQKIRIRFLQDMEEGMELLWHDSFDRGIAILCQEHFGRECEYCGDDTLRTRNQYCWSVWNYEANEVQLFMFPVNNCSPIPSLVAMYENYGTLVDRDYVISVTGKQQNKTFTVIPMDKVKFRNDKAKPFSEKAVLKMIDKAWPNENVVASDDDDDTPLPRNKKKQAAKSKPKAKPAKDDEDEFDDDDYDKELPFGEDDSTEDKKSEYSDMSAVDLYKLCKERGLDAMKRKNEKYYIGLLEEDDAAHDEWEDSEDAEDEDEWGDD